MNHSKPEIPLYFLTNAQAEPCPHCHWEHGLLEMAMISMKIVSQIVGQKPQFQLIPVAVCSKCRKPRYTLPMEQGTIAIEVPMNFGRNPLTEDPSS